MLRILLVLLVVIYCEGQNVILPRLEIEDIFKDNPKWDEFKLVQAERIGRLKTLVNNVWHLVDSISYPGPKFNFKEAFMRYNFRAFLDFFRETEDRLRDGYPFSVINPTVGLQNIAKLLKVSNSSDSLNEFRRKWADVDAMALAIHQVFNKTSEAILQPGKITEPDKIVDIVKGLYPLNLTSNQGEGESKSKSLDDIASKIDEEITSLGSDDKHLLRGLVEILRNVKQSDLDLSAYMNYFCYGNNEFGILPELLDFLSDATLYLIVADLKKLVLDIYVIALPILSSESDAKVKDILPLRSALWDTMLSRVTRKYNFTYLNGTGWGSSASPVIFKCDVPPEISGGPGQWGKNVTTGASPEATPRFPHDPQSGPVTPEGLVGYFDDRSPLVQAVAFDGVFQGYIESELVLSHPNPTCIGTCEEYTSKTKTCDPGEDHRCSSLRSYHCDSDHKSCMRKSSCPSFARKCVRASSNTTMCLSSDPAKRYDWINLNGRILKPSTTLNASECAGGPPASAVERWEMSNHIILKAPQYCELCLCTCMSPQNESAQMYFDIQPSLSDTSGGMLVSAVRFVKEGNVIRLAIEQAKPTMKGHIDESTLKWVDPLPSDIQDPTKTVPIGLTGFMKFNIDLIIGEVGHVLTGIRFRKDNDSLSLEIQTTPIFWPEDEPTKITLKTDESVWKCANPSTMPKEPVVFLKPNNPTVQSGPSMPDSILNSFVEFTTTTYEDDLAQTVIPFFDTQPVHYYDGRRWLRGVGTIHKGKPNSGGFLAPLIVPATPYISIRYFPTPHSS